MNTKRIRVALLGFLVLALFAAAVLVPVEAWNDVLTDPDRWRSPRGVVLFILVYIVWNFALPPAPLQLMAGLHFGLFGGLAVIVVGTSLANIVSHAVARWLGRTWVADRAEESDHLRAMEKAVAQMGWKAVVLLRLSNLLPSNLANLLMGVTPLRLHTILWASLVGSLPGWALMLSLGHGGRLLLDAQEQTPTEWAIYIGGAVAALILLIVLGIRAKNILKKLEEKELEKEQGEEKPPDE